MAKLNPSMSTENNSTDTVTCYVFHNTNLTFPVAFIDTPSPGKLTVKKV